jgi:tetratricopeptide (TPR) repeat protein
LLPARDIAYNSRKRLEFNYEVESSSGQGQPYFAGRPGTKHGIAAVSTLVGKRGFTQVVAKSGKSRNLDYWIAGAMVLITAVFGGPDLIRWCSTLVRHPDFVASSREAPRMAADFINAGMKYYRASDFRAAEAEFRNAIRADSKSALAYNDLGATLNNQKRWDEAITILRKAIELDPAMDLARNNLAYSLAQKTRGGNEQK